MKNGTGVSREIEIMLTQFDQLNDLEKYTFLDNIDYVFLAKAFDKKTRGAISDVCGLLNDTINTVMPLVIECEKTKKERK